MRPITRRLGLASAAVASLPRFARAQPDELSVLMPDDQNLQFMAFWLALGDLSRRGIVPRIVTPEHRRLVVERFTNGAAPLAVLPAPLYQALIAGGVPLRLVGNLLRHEPINLVMRGDVASQLPPPRAPLAERLAALKSKRIGIARGPVKRLNAMLAAGGLAPDHVTRITVPGSDQNEAFAEGDVDGLFAHTPYLERAIVDQGGVLYVHPSGGEVPALTGLLVHALVATPSFVEAQPGVLVALLRAVAASHRAAAPALLAERFADRPPEHLTTIARLLGPALPRSVRPTLDAVRRTVALFPALHRQPVAEEQLAAAIDDRFAREAEAEAPLSPKALAPLAALLAGGATGWLLRRRAVRRGGL